MESLETVAESACTAVTVWSTDISNIRFVLLLVFGAAMFGLISELNTTFHAPAAPTERHDRPAH